MAAYKTSVVHTCPGCHKDFSTALIRKKYCSQDCRISFHRRVHNETYGKPPKEKLRPSTVETVECAGCGTAFTYTLFSKSIRRRYCTKKCYHERYSRQGLGRGPRPTGIIEELGDKDLSAIQLIWHTFDYSALYVFPDTRDVRKIHDSMSVKEMFHEWVVYTIIFQAHIMFRYERIVQIPGLVKADFLRLCQKYRITLQDSEAFAEDIKCLT